MARGEGDEAGPQCGPVVRRQQVEPAGQVLQPVGDEVDDVAGTLDASPDQDETRAQHRLAKTLQHPGPDHDVHDAGFIFQRHEDNAAGAARALADQDEAGRGCALAVPGTGHRLGRKHAFLRQVPAQEGDRMRPERKPE